MIPVWNELAALDTWAFHLINGIPRIEWLDAFGRLLSSAPLWWGVALALLLVGVWKRRRGAVGTLGICLLSVGITDPLCAHLLKPQLDRERPCWQIPERQLRVVSCGGKYGLPSNHAANGMAVVASTVGWVSPQATLGLVGVVALVGLSRVFLGVHYPGDILLGFLVGGLIGWGVRRLARGVTGIVKKRQETVKSASQLS